MVRLAPAGGSGAVRPDGELADVDLEVLSAEQPRVPHLPDPSRLKVNFG
jgi:hypothetical protein